MPQPVEIPEGLDGAHELIREAAAAYLEEDRTWYDGRIWLYPPKPGLFYLRVAPKHLEFVLRALQGVVAASERRGLEIGPVERSRLHRAGVGIGLRGNLAALEVIELRGLGFGSKKDVDQWRWVNEHRLPSEGTPPSQPRIPRGNGKLRLILPRRHDWPDPSGPGWRRNFTALAGAPFQALLADVVASLENRANAGA